MGKLWNRFTRRQLALGISGVLSFLVCLSLLFWSNRMAASLEEQQMAARWSKEGGVAQVSCFFSPKAYMDQDTIEEFEHSLDSALQEASITLESENPSARLWADAYSADGTITVSSDKTSLTADAIGIGGDFFLFHPLKLVSGSYFSGNDIIKDYCVIDEDAAWQLFGSSDVAGQMVYIGGVPHVVTGVVERPSGRLEEAAGLDSTLVYVSLETLEQWGNSSGLNHYEIILPNPVRGFALKTVQERLGGNEKETEVLENSSRYSFSARWKNLLAFGTRSMNGKAIIYPYWENVARGYEDIIALLTVVMLMFLLYPTVLAGIAVVLWWRHRSWTVKDMWYWAKDKAERLAERIREKRKNAKQGEKRKKKGNLRRKKSFSFMEDIDFGEEEDGL